MLPLYIINMKLVNYIKHFFKKEQPSDNLIQTNKLSPCKIGENECELRKSRLMFTFDFYDIVRIVSGNNLKIKIIIERKIDKVKFFLKIIEYSDWKDTYNQERIHGLIKNDANVHFINVKDFYTYNNSFYSIYENFDGMNLLDYIFRNDIRGDVRVIMNILEQLLLGVRYLHGRRIIHCDLKLENILINEGYCVKIIDFDLSKMGDENNEYVSDLVFGTKNYLSPESYDLGIYSTKSDLWSLGIVLYAIIMGEFPHKHNLSYINSFSNLQRWNVFKHIDLSGLKESECGIFFYGIIESMITFNVNKRKGIHELLISYYNKKVEFQPLCDRNKN